MSKPVGDPFSLAEYLQPPSVAPPETAQEMTEQIGHLIVAVRAMEERADAALRAAEKPSPAPPRVRAQPRKPLAWSAATVAVAVALCLLLAWVAFLVFT